MHNLRNTQTVSDIPESDVRAELDRILASKGFTSAGRLSKLLRYVVDKTLAGESDQLKEYAVGVEVFERDGQYDPRLDSIVRVEAGRLRTKLDEYYNGNGNGSDVRIGLPRGAYVATFERRHSVLGSDPESASHSVSGSDPKSEFGQARHSPAAIAFAAVLLLSIGAMVLWLVMRDRTVAIDTRPTAAILPIEANMIGGDNDNYSAQMTEAITSELARLGTISVASYTNAMQFAGRRPSMSEVAAALQSRYVVEASVDDEASEILVVARMVNSETGRKMWVSDYRGARDDVRGIAQRIAFDVSAEILRRESGR
jgi:TolB-like protein